jgi:hypothetical protein
MKVFLEADFTEGNGALRWEGVTLRRFRKLVLSAIAIVTVIAVFVARHWVH